MSALVVCVDPEDVDASEDSTSDGGDSQNAQLAAV